MNFFDELRNDITSSDNEIHDVDREATLESEVDSLTETIEKDSIVEDSEASDEKNNISEASSIAAQATEEDDDTNIIRKTTYYICYFTVAFCIGFLFFSYVSERNSYKNLDAMRLALENERARLRLENVGSNSDDIKGIDQASIDDILGTRELISAEEIAELERLSIDPKERRKREKQLITPLGEYEYFFKQNDDFAGWIDVSGTTIDYPLMQGMDNEYYLTHGFEKQKDKFGMLTLDFRCPLIGDCGEYIIYGHNVRDGKMFGELLNFKAKGYYDYHPTIEFDTVVNRGTYHIFAVIVTQVYPGSVPEYECMSIGDADGYRDFVKNMKTQSLYDIDYEPKELSPILALVTCEKTTDTGRFVVLAAKD